MDEWVYVTIGSHKHRIIKPVADTFGLRDGDVRGDDETLCDQIIDRNWQYIRARQDRIKDLQKPE
jgi:hypothetical protein